MSSVSARVSIFAVLLLSAPARAQTPASAPAVVPATESSATAIARISVERAKALVDGGDYNAALAELMRAQELLHGDPRQADVLNNIAVCYERMFRYDLALHYYERYLRESTTASAEDRGEVEAAMAVLIDLLGTVRVTGLHGADVWIDDHKVGKVPLEALVPAGSRVIEVRARGYESTRRELRVVARTMHTVDAQLEKIEAYEGLPSTYFWIGTGLTAAAAITGTVLGVAAMNEHAQGEEDAERGLPVDGQDARDLALQADIAFGATLAFGIGTAVLFFLTDLASSPDGERRTSSLAFHVDVTSSSFGLGFQGTAP
jgi:tetratricopeptide (TPR) repeat protein